MLDAAEDDRNRSKLRLWLVLEEVRSEKEVTRSSMTKRQAHLGSPKAVPLSHGAEASSIRSWPCERGRSGVQFLASGVPDSIARPNWSSFHVAFSIAIIPIEVRTAKPVCLAAHDRCRTAGFAAVAQ